MLRILSWNSNGSFEKLRSEDVPSSGQNANVPLVPVANSSGKRKRSLDPSLLPADTEAVKALVKDGLKTITSSLTSSDVTTREQTQQLPNLPEQSIPASSQPITTKIEMESPEVLRQRAKSKQEAQMATIRQTISSQLSLEILMKHKELRLIDQELAKCQIALEQLRRCTEVPYPALQKPSEEVSLGTGPGLRRTNDRYPAKSPAPWGVADGPYSRHYARWLLPDPHFDGGEPDMVISASTGSTPLHGRSTRGVYTDFAQMVGKTSRSQRALHQALPPGFIEPKQKPTGPMILKRKSDGRMVKLVCPDCHRFDFGSAQGFINHCRIGHQRNYASHDAAAEGCGEPLEGDESVAHAKDTTQVAASAPVTPLPTPIVTAPISFVAPVTTLPATPVQLPTPVSATSSGTHPLIISAHMTSKEKMAQPLVAGGYVPKADRKSSQTKDGQADQTQCSQTPHLAGLMSSRGMSMDLQAEVEEAKRRDDLPEEYWDEMDLDSPLPTPNEHGRHPPKGGKKPSAKSVASSFVRKPSFSTRRDGPKGSFDSVSTTGDEHRFHHFMPLLPSPTNESTQAPSLIADDEEMDPHSPSSSDENDEHDETDVHVHVRDFEHPEEHHEPEMPPTCQQTARSEQPQVPNPSPFAQPLSSTDNRKGNFMAEAPSNDDHGDKKRRKLGQ